MGLGFDYQFKIFWKNKGFRRVLRLLPPRSLDQGADYLNGLVEMNLASRMVAGTIRSYQQATVLHLAPINLIGVAISTAAFPKMTERLSQGRPDLFKSELQSVLRIIIWLALPVATITYFTRGYLVNFIYNGGDSLIAGLLGTLAVAIIFRSIYYIAARSFYAQQDTKTPLYISIFAISLNIALAIYFTMGLNMGAYGLAWAQSLVAFVEVMILFNVMSRRIGGLFDAAFMGAIWKMVGATSIMGVVSYGAVLLFQLGANDQSFLATFPKFVLIATISFISYVILSRLLKLPEVNPVLSRIRKLLFERAR
jgi:putative peptidoglycan lipid II flippase